MISIEPGVTCDGARFGIRRCPFTQHDPATGESTRVGGVIGTPRIVPT
jgi:hypothetical protein